MITYENRDWHGKQNCLNGREAHFCIEQELPNTRVHRHREDKWL